MAATPPTIASPTPEAPQTPKPLKPEKNFRNKDPRISPTPVLRMKDGESLEDAISRLGAAGWLIPGPGQVDVSSDSMGKYFELR